MPCPFTAALLCHRLLSHEQRHMLREEVSLGVSTAKWNGAPQKMVRPDPTSVEWRAAPSWAQPQQSEIGVPGVQCSEKAKPPPLVERGGAGKGTGIACVRRGERAAAGGGAGWDRAPPLDARALVGAGARGPLGLAHMARP